MSSDLSSDRRIAAVVVNKDAGEHLLACVASLRSAGIAEIVVVDNDSDDGSVAALRAADPTTTIVELGANPGYGTAVNLGFTISTTPFVVIANPDVEVDPDAPAILREALLAHREVALAGPEIVEASGARYPSARSFPSARTAIGHALFGLVFPDNRFSRRYRLENEDLTTSREVDWLSGAFLLVRREAFLSVNGFDEGYFMYVEDLDLCWRLRRAGWRARFEPGASVRHVQGVSAARRPYRMLVAHHASTWRFARRSAGGLHRIGLPLVGAGIAARLAVALSREAYQRRIRPRPRLR